MTRNQKNFLKFRYQVIQSLRDHPLEEDTRLSNYAFLLSSNQEYKAVRRNASKYVLAKKLYHVTFLNLHRKLNQNPDTYVGSDTFINHQLLPPKEYVLFLGLPGTFYEDLKENLQHYRLLRNIRNKFIPYLLATPHKRVYHKSFYRIELNSYYPPVEKNPIKIFFWLRYLNLLDNAPVLFNVNQLNYPNKTTIHFAGKKTIDKKIRVEYSFARKGTIFDDKLEYMSESELRKLFDDYLDSFTNPILRKLVRTINRDNVFIRLKSSTLQGY